MQVLPIGVQSFEKLRKDNLLYVDKTGILQELLKNGQWYFLSRPRRFGKSLTLSTLDAMFSGKADLFKGLKAEEWVTEQKKHPSPVLRLDMSSLGSYKNGDELDQSIIRRLEDFVEDNDLRIRIEHKSGEMFRQIIRRLNKTNGSVVVLIDEYDKPILDNISDLDKANEMREVLRSFYSVLKSCDEYLRFVMLTGISKFSKVGVFSTLNNLHDISMLSAYGNIVGYTQQEIEENFSEWLASSSSAMSMMQNELLEKIRDYYDGFSFDGKNRLYNPFSILNFFWDKKFGNYWYTSGSPSFIVKYMKEHKIRNPEEYRHIEVPQDFSDSQEIESSTPESFLYQSGYLTIEKWENDVITLDYPNEEVKKSLVRMYLNEIYRVKRFITLGNEIWKALDTGDISEVIRLYNIALSEIPYDDFPNRDEFWYRSLFLMLLRGAGVIAYAEVHTFKGRSDVVVQFERKVVILEFKFAKDHSDVDKKRIEGLEQMKDREYDKAYSVDGRKVISSVIVANDEARQVE